jgi:hypothetical protein
LDVWWEQGSLKQAQRVGWESGYGITIPTPKPNTHPPNLLSIYLYSTIPSSTPPTGHRTDHFSRPVLEQIWDISDGVAVGEEIPTSGAVAVVVEPRSEDQVGGYTEKEAVKRV